MTSLDVWMAGNPIATIREVRKKMTLTYASGAAPLGTPLISVAMPVSTAPYSDRVVRPFFHGLLPEGPARQTIAYDLGIAADDDGALLAALGRDCAGALAVVPEGEAPTDTGETPQRLDDADVATRLRALPVFPLGVTGPVRASLPGVQPKLLLTRIDGQWRAPGGRHPTTHLLKPPIPELPGSVANEAFCLRLASDIGLRTAVTDTATFADTTVLVSERYDRHIAADGRSIRLHQEDACQALSVMTFLPRHKYEGHGGPKLRKIADVLTRWGGSPLELLQFVAYSVIVGNADLHGKNVSFLHRGDGTIELAPMYDVMCTTVYDGAGGTRRVDTELGLFINGRRDILEVTTDDIVAEARSWGIRASAAEAVVQRLSGAVLDAIDAARSDLTVDVSDDIVDRIRRRAEDFAPHA